MVVCIHCFCFRVTKALATVSQRISFRCEDWFQAVKARGVMRENAERNIHAGLS